MVRRSLRTALAVTFTASTIVLGLLILSAISTAVGPRSTELWLLISGFDLVAFLASAVGLIVVVFGADRAVSIAALVHALALFALVITSTGPGLAVPVLVGLFDIAASFFLIEHARIERDVLG